MNIKIHLALMALIALTGCAADPYQEAEVDTNCTQNGVCNFIDTNETFLDVNLYLGVYPQTLADSLVIDRMDAVECADPPNGSDEGCVSYRMEVKPQ